MSSQPTAADDRAASAEPAEYHAASHLTGESLRIAAIDVGSNSIHMVVAQLDPDGGVTTLWRMKEPTGLGRLTFPVAPHRSADAMDRALATLARFKHAARNKAAEKIVAVATSAVREAVNGGDLIERAKRELKFPIRVVSAKEEARLIYLGIRHGGCFGDEARRAAPGRRHRRRQRRVHRRHQRAGDAARKPQARRGPHDRPLHPRATRRRRRRSISSGRTTTAS